MTTRQDKPPTCCECKQPVENVDPCNTVQVCDRCFASQAMTTRQQKEKFITKKCAEVNPGIMELKEGCRVNIGNEYGTYLYCGAKDGNCGNLRVTPSGGYENIYKQKHWHWIAANKRLRGVHRHSFEIIGRPIQLADICVALNKAIIGEMDIVVTLDGHFLEIHDSTECGIVSYEATEYYWNLLKNRLQDQSDELVSFLFGVMGGV